MLCLQIPNAKLITSNSFRVQAVCPRLRISAIELAKYIETIGTDALSNPTIPYFDQGNQNGHAVCGLYREHSQ
jgi:hypothetical protein